MKVHLLSTIALNDALSVVLLLVIGQFAAHIAAHHLRAFQILVIVRPVSPMICNHSPLRLANC